MRLYLLNTLVGLAAAETGIDAWLRYAPLPGGALNHQIFPGQIVALNSTQSSPVFTAGIELQKGLGSITGSKVSVVHYKPHISNYVVVGTVDEFSSVFGNATVPEVEPDGFYLDNKGDNVQILGQNERGALYGAFEYLSMLAQGNISEVSYASNPAAPVRWVNQWDNLDGSIERGYGGPSIFFANGTVLQDLTRAAQYAGLLSSLGINAAVVNNANADANLLLPENIEGLARIADAFRPYGVQVGISLNFASPQLIANLSTYDPLNASVIEFWQDITDQLYQAVPDMAGYLVKADSEGEPGPLVYNRTLAQGANLFAKPLQKYGGIVMFRAFVYNLLNESDWRADRANAAVQFFQGLDGEFDDNVVVQIKYGPIDFQVREPASPLFAHLQNTNTAIELEVAQEYLGQQCHLVYLPPLWQTMLDFDLRVDHQPSLVRDIVTGKRFKRPLSGSAAVVNVGMNQTWLGSHFAMSNLYSYGRLAWNNAQDPEALLQDWSRLTFGLGKQVLDTVTQMSMDSWPAYENYSGNLGIQTLTDILFNHYAANPASQENNGYGQWTRADHLTVGMDRTVWNGTGYSGQYPEEIYQMYEGVETTPDDLLLWFHHVNWTHALHSGETVIQHFYNAHYEGAATAYRFPSMWTSLQNKIDKQRFEEVLFRFTYQAGHAIVWRDAISNWFYDVTGIADDAGRVGHHPWRIEAEAMQLTNYMAYRVNPFEDASNATAILTISNTTTGTAQTLVPFADGVYDIGVNYFDLIGGISHWTLYLNERDVGDWMGNAEHTLGHAPTTFIDSTANTRVTFPQIAVRRGDVLKIVGRPDGIEPAPLDYVVFLPNGVVD